MIHQVQQTSSQCPQCSRHKHNHISSTPSSQSQQHQPQNQSQSYQQNHRRFVIPINKRIIQKNTHKNTHIQQTLNILTKEVEKLKKENKEKEKKIRKLEQEINRKQERYHRSNGKVGAIYEYELGRKSTKNQQPRKSILSKSKRVHTEYPYAQQNYPTNTSKKQLLSSRVYVQEMQNILKQLTIQKNNKIQKLQQQLQQIQQENKELQSRLDLQINDNEWLTKFCLLFVGMAQQLSKMQGQNIVKPNASLRKNTKIAWKYIKGFVKKVML